MQQDATSVVFMEMCMDTEEWRASIQWYHTDSWHSILLDQGTVFRGRFERADAMDPKEAKKNSGAIPTEDLVVIESHCQWSISISHYCHVDG